MMPLAPIDFASCVERGLVHVLPRLELARLEPVDVEFERASAARSAAGGRE